MYEHTIRLLETIESLPPGHIARFLPDVDFAFADDRFNWTDPVWGEVDLERWGVDGGNEYVPLFAELLVHPAITRLIAIEQLTLPDRYSTMPNAERFSRWEHVTGSGEFTSQLIDKWNRNNPEKAIGSREKTIYILRTMLSDVAHTFGSHLGDWIQGDESEEAHDWSLKSYLEMTGLAGILTRYGISIDEVCLTEIAIQDFIEKKSPYLCVDRIDYGVREIHRTNPYFWDPSRRFTIDDFELTMDSEGVLQVIMPQPSRALLFAKSYELLPQEDWSESLQRLQTYLYTRLVKLLLIAIAEGRVKTLMAQSELPPFPDSDEWIPEADRDYRDIMNYTEGIIGHAINEVSRICTISPGQQDEVLAAIATIDVCMQQISKLAREYVVQTRSKIIADFTESVDKGEINPDEEIPKRPRIYHSENDGPISSIHFLNATQLSSEDLGSIHLKAQKMRSVDPTITILDDRPISISDILEYMPSLKAYEDLYVRITYVDNQVQTTMDNIDGIIDTKWPIPTGRKRMSSTAIREYQHVLKMLSAGLDYARYTRAGALEEVEIQRDFDNARAWSSGRRHSA